MFSFQEMDVKTQHRCHQLATTIETIHKQNGSEAAIKMYIRITNMIGFYLGLSDPALDMMSPDANRWMVEEQSRLLAEFTSEDAHAQAVDWMKSLSSYLDELAEVGESHGRAL